MFDGCSGGKASEISFAYKNRTLASLTFQEAEDLLLSMRQSAKPVKANRLGSAAACFEAAHYSKVTGRLVLPSTRGFVEAEIPLVVETWANISPDKTNIFAHVNRTPITGELRAYLSRNTIDVYGCGLSCSLKVPTGKSFNFWLNIITPFMPITTDGKEPDFRSISVYITEAMEKSVSKAKRNMPAAATEERIKNQRKIIIEKLDDAIVLMLCEDVLMSSKPTDCQSFVIKLHTHPPQH